MAPVTIAFNNRDTTPPVYVAGSFTNWQPVEIESVATGAEGQGPYIYEKTFDLVPGTYQYKFRLGPGDWWVCDAQSQLDRDASGNENNVIVVEAQPEPEQPELESKSAPGLETAKPEPTAISTINEAEIAPKEETSLVSSISKPEVHDAPQTEKDIETVSEPIETTNDKAAVLTNGIHSQVTVQSTVAPENESTKVETPKVVEPRQVVEEFKIQEKDHVAEPEIVIQSPPETDKVISKPVNQNVDGASSFKPTTKESKSQSTSISSTKEKASGDQMEEPKKLSWFSRIFLCGSSRTTMLAAFVITVPIFAAILIKK